MSTTAAPRFARAITYFGQACTVACDGNGLKAWGIQQRPRIELSDDPDDYASLADGELGDAPGDAPADPGTYEGGDGKPFLPASGSDLNRWCVRQRERSVVVDAGDPILLPDLSIRRFNMAHRRAV